MLSNRLKALVDEQGISIYQIAKDLDMRYATLYDLINREDLSMTRLGALVALCDYLGIELTDAYEKTP